MSYKLKTLIVFDTNSLRSTEAGKVSYSSFSFGKSYDSIYEFIKESKIEDFVSLAVSTMVISELKNQKQRQYKEDIQQLKDIVKRLTGLPHIPSGLINIPDENFDCGSYIEEKAKKYIHESNINTLEYKDEHAPIMLKNMLEKVVGNENSKSPFARSGKFNDAGFKDSVIWETLMHYEKVSEFDKVIFFSKDGDYKDNCIEDFKNKWQKHISIEKAESTIISILEKDYGNYIEKREIYNFAQKDYFNKYLSKDLTYKSNITIDGNEYKIENFKIIEICKKVNKLPPNEDLEENIEIISEIKIFYSDKKEKKEQLVEAKTLLLDDQTKEIISTEYNMDIK